MKTIYLIRHAKSDWSDAALDDINRGLNKRGKKSIPIMAKVLKEKKIKPDIIISSPAKRTKLTINRLLKELGYKTKIKYTDELYLADPNTILSVVKEINDKYDSVFIIGHNPGLSEFANLMSDADIKNIPTLGIVAIKCKIKNWIECGYQASMQFFIYPKMFKE
ncbi:MAG: histidine phosphatase family protein [Campylobacterales bacterium]|nr:histidine phosphatase family protein [Campylobacterales bacterium]